MYIGINKFSVSALDHKPLHVFRIQQEVAYNASRSPYMNTSN